MVASLRTMSLRSLQVWALFLLRLQSVSTHRVTTTAQAVNAEACETGAFPVPSLLLCRENVISN